MFLLFYERNLVSHHAYKEPSCCWRFQRTVSLLRSRCQGAIVAGFHEVTAFHELYNAFMLLVPCRVVMALVCHFREVCKDLRWSKVALMHSLLFSQRMALLQDSWSKVTCGIVDMLEDRLEQHLRWVLKYGCLNACWLNPVCSVMQSCFVQNLPW